MTTKQFPLGSVSTGTLRPEDLLPAFVSALESLSPMGTNHPYLGDAYQILEQGTDDESETWDALDEAIRELLSDIEHELGNLCPPFVYFGAHPGDGADFGFWVDMDRLENETGDLDIDNSGEYVLDNHIVRIEDRGSDVTLMDLDRNVVWSTL